jgi:hypothetical protein
VVVVVVVRVRWWCWVCCGVGGVCGGAWGVGVVGGCGWGWGGGWGWGVGGEAAVVVVVITLMLFHDDGTNFVDFKSKRYSWPCNRP